MMTVDCEVLAMSDDKRISRRAFLLGAAGVAAAAAAATFVPGTQVFRAAKNGVRSLAAGLEARYVRQVMTASPSTSRTIMWAAAAPIAEPAVEYRLAAGASAAISRRELLAGLRPFGRAEAAAASEGRVSAVDSSFTDDGVRTTQYTASLEDLSPGRKYEYRIVSADRASEWRPLVTPPLGSAGVASSADDDTARAADGYTALIFPDSQSSDYSDWEGVARGAFSRNTDAAFFINMGDLVDNGEDHTQWQAWLAAVEPLSAAIPVAPVMGNHECYTIDWQTRLPEAYLHYFAVPDNGSAYFSRYYYSFDYGDVHYIVLNTQEDEVAEFKQGLIDEQIEWLRRDVAASQAKWRVVLMHRDVLRYRIHGRPERTEGVEYVGEVFMPIFDELGIDIVFTAHLHTYRNRGRLYAGRRAERGPLYILTGVAGNVRYPGLWIDHACDVATAPQPETDNYITLEVTAGALTVRCYLPDGTEIDSARVEK